jgi:hypothetical protein
MLRVVKVSFIILVHNRRAMVMGAMVDQQLLGLHLEFLDIQG